MTRESWLEAAWRRGQAVSRLREVGGELVALHFREALRHVVDLETGRERIWIDGKRVRRRASKGWRRHVRRLKASRKSLTP